MAIIAVVSGLALCLVVVRWCASAWGIVGRKPPLPLIRVLLLTVLTAVSGTITLRHHVLERRLSTVASSLAGRPVRVECQSLISSFLDGRTKPGIVYQEPGGRPGKSTDLDGDICRSLDAYLKSPTGYQPDDRVIAVHVVTHEAMHMAGTFNEAEAECEAVQRDARTARLLGASRADAAALATRYWRDIHPRLTREYRSGACVPGGALDEGLADGPW